MPATVTSSQQRRFLELRNGKEPDPFAGISAIVASLRGLTDVAAEGAAKRAAEETATRPPLEVKAKVTPDGRTLFDLKNLSTDGDPADVAQAAYDEPNRRFNDKFLALRREDPNAIDVGSIVEMLRGRRAEPIPEAAAPAAVGDVSIGEDLAGAATSIGLPTTDRAAIERELGSFGGVYRAERDSGKGLLRSILAAAAVKALPDRAENAVKKRIADAQVTRRVMRLGQVYGTVAPLMNMLQSDRSAAIDMFKTMSTMDGRTRDDLMAAVRATPYLDLPAGTDPYDYTAQLANLGVLPPAFKPFIDAKISEEKRQRQKTETDAEYQRKRDERAEEAAARADASAARAEEDQRMQRERFSAWEAKLAAATTEKPEKLKLGDAKLLPPEYVVALVGDERAHQGTVTATLQRQLKINSDEYSKLTSERVSIQKQLKNVESRLVDARKRAEEVGTEGARSRVAKLEAEQSALATRTTEIDQLRVPLVKNIDVVKRGLHPFSARDEAAIKAYMAKKWLGPDQRSVAIEALQSAGVVK